VKALSKIYIVSEPADKLHKLKLMEEFCKNLHNQWRIYSLVAQSEYNNADALTRSISILFQTTFFSIVHFFKSMHCLFEGPHLVIGFNIFSYLNFCRVDTPTYQEVTKQMLQIIHDEEDPEKVEPTVVSLFDLLPTDLFTIETPPTKKGGKNVERPVEDLVSLSRTTFLLSVLEKVIHRAPTPLLRDRVLPLLFVGFRSQTESINKYCHSLMKSLFSNYDHVSMKISTVVPLYVRTCLEHHPGITPIHAFRETLVVIVQNLPETENALTLFVLKTMSDRIHYFIAKGTPKMNLAKAFFNLISVVHLQLLDPLLDMITVVMKTLPKGFWPALCEFLFNTISDNFDYTRKNKCLKWYLDLLSELKIENNTEMPLLMSRL